MLALVSKEHLYCEGPPGVAKTLLAESVANLTGLRTFTYQMHRDTRLHELVGDTVIMRQQSPDGGEVIKQSTRPGGILTAKRVHRNKRRRAGSVGTQVRLRTVPISHSNSDRRWDQVENIMRQVLRAL